MVLGSVVLAFRRLPHSPCNAYFSIAGGSASGGQVKDATKIGSYSANAQFLNGSTAWWSQKYDESELFPLDFAGTTLADSAARARAWLSEHVRV